MRNKELVQPLFLRHTVSKNSRQLLPISCADHYMTLHPSLANIRKRLMYTCFKDKLATKRKRKWKDCMPATSLDGFKGKLKQSYWVKKSGFLFNNFGGGSVWL